MLYVNDAPAGDAHGAAVAADDAVPAASTSSPDVLARGLGFGGLVVGAAGLAFGLTSPSREAKRVMRARVGVAAIIIAVVIAGPVGFADPCVRPQRAGRLDAGVG